LCCQGRRRGSPNHGYEWHENGNATFVDGAVPEKRGKRLQDFTPITSRPGEPHSAIKRVLDADKTDERKAETREPGQA